MLKTEEAVFVAGCSPKGYDGISIAHEITDIAKKSDRRYHKYVPLYLTLVMFSVITPRRIRDAGGCRPSDLRSLLSWFGLRGLYEDLELRQCAQEYWNTAVSPSIQLESHLCQLFQLAVPEQPCIP